MNEDQLKKVLAKVEDGDRAAFRDLFDHLGPYLLEHLSQHSMSVVTARAAFVETFGQIWDGTCHFPENSDVPRRDRIVKLALDQALPRANESAPLIKLDEALWQSVTQRCYPESWRNILRRLDIKGAVVCALVSAVAIMIVQWL